MVPVHVEGVRRNVAISSAYMYTASLVDEAGERMFPLLLSCAYFAPVAALASSLSSAGRSIGKSR